MAYVYLYPDDIYISKSLLFPKALNGELAGWSLSKSTTSLTDPSISTGRFNDITHSAPKVRLEGCGDNVTRRKQKIIRVDVWMDRRLVVENYEKNGETGICPFVSSFYSSLKVLYQRVL